MRPIGARCAFLCMVGIAMVLAGCATRSVVVRTASMEPTIPAGAAIVIDARAYEDSDPSRFDIVSFIPPDPAKHTFVFRVIGLPGERIQLRDDSVLINGAPLDLPDNLRYESTQSPRWHTISDITLRQDEFFLLGDDTKTAWDSRFLGPISKDRITGRVIQVVPQTRADGNIAPAEESSD